MLTHLLIITPLFWCQRVPWYRAFPPWRANILLMPGLRKFAPLLFSNNWFVLDIMVLFFVGIWDSWFLKTTWCSSGCKKASIKGQEPPYQWPYQVCNFVCCLYSLCLSEGGLVIYSIPVLFLYFLPFLFNCEGGFLVFGCFASPQTLFKQTCLLLPHLALYSLIQKAYHSKLLSNPLYCMFNLHSNNPLI